MPNYNRPLKLAELALARGETYWSVLRKGALLYRCGRYDEAKQQLERASDLSSDDSWSLEKLFLAMVHLRLGDPSRAQEYVTEAENRMNQAADRVTWVERAQFALLRTQARELLVANGFQVHSAQRMRFYL